MDGVPSVLTDNRAGILEAMDHLVDVHGIRRIAFLKGPEINHEAKARFAAYREALASRGLEEDPSLWIQGDFTRAGAVRALSAHCRGQAKPDFQAVLAANDEMAIGALEALREHGCSVPRDVAIVGFDNIQDAQFVLPSLTTVGQLLIDQGRTAAELAARLARERPAPRGRAARPARPPDLVRVSSPERRGARLAAARARRTGSRAVDAGRVIAQLESQFRAPPPRPCPWTPSAAPWRCWRKNAGTKAFLDTFQEILNGEVASGNHITAGSLS